MFCDPHTITPLVIQYALLLDTLSNIVSLKKLHLSTLEPNSKKTIGANSCDKQTK